MEDAVRLVSQLNSSNWSMRHAAIAELLEQSESGPEGALRQQTTKVLDAFVLRLCDSNSKVNLFALQALEQMLPVLRDLQLGPVMSVMIQNTAGNLASKNQEIARTASRLLDAFINQLGECRGSDAIYAKPPLRHRVQINIERRSSPLAKDHS